MEGVKLRGKIPTEDDSQSSEGSNRYEKLLDNFAKELREYDNEHEQELQKANEQCQRLKTQLQATEEELTKTNELLSDEKMLRSKAELERDSLASLAEKLEILLLKYIPTDSQSEDLIQRYEKLLQDNFSKELRDYDRREKIKTLELELQSAELKLQEVEIRRDSLAGLTEKLEIFLLRYDQHFSAAAGRLVEFIELPNVMFSTELDWNKKMDYECDTEDVLKLSPLASTIDVKNEIADEASSSSSSTTSEDDGFSILEEPLLKQEILNKPCVLEKFCSLVQEKRTSISYNFEREQPPWQNKVSRSSVQCEENAVVPLIAAEKMKTRSSTKTATCSLRTVRILRNKRGSKEKAKLLMKGDLPNKPIVQSAPKIRNSRLYLNDSDWRCDICGKYYSTKSSLKEHKLGVHDGIKPFKCTKCNKAFSRRHVLKDHDSRYHRS